MKLLTVSAVFLLFLTLSGCGRPDPVKIGFLGTLSGNSSELGVYERNAVKLAVNEINKAGGIKGRRIELIVADDKGNPADGLKAAEALAASGVIAVIGQTTTGPQALSVPYFRKLNILMISPSVTTSALSGIDDNYIKLAGSNDKQAQALADYAISSLKLRRFAVIYDINNKGYAQGIAKHFTVSAQKLGGSIVYNGIFHSSNYSALSEIADTLKLIKPDAVLFSASGMDNAVFCQILEKKTINVPVLTGIWAGTDDLIDYGGKTIDRIITVNSFNWEDSSRRYRQFRKIYFDKYKQNASYSAAFAYEAAHILFDAIEKSKYLQFDDLKARIVNRVFPGLQQDFYIDKYGDVNRKLNVLKIQNGRFIKVN